MSLAIAKASTRNPIVTIFGPPLGGGENRVPDSSLVGKSDGN